MSDKVDYLRRGRIVFCISMGRAGKIDHVDSVKVSLATYGPVDEGSDIAAESGITKLTYCRALTLSDHPFDDIRPATEAEKRSFRYQRGKSISGSVDDVLENDPEADSANMSWETPNEPVGRVSGGKGDKGSPYQICDRFRFKCIHNNGSSRVCECGLKYDEHTEQAQQKEVCPGCEHIATNHDPYADQGRPCTVPISSNGYQRCMCDGRAMGYGARMKKEK